MKNKLAFQEKPSSRPVRKFLRKIGLTALAFGGALLLSSSALTGCSLFEKSLSQRTAEWIEQSKNQEFSDLYERFQKGELISTGKLFLWEKEYYFEKKDGILIAYTDNEKKEIVAFFVDNNIFKEGQTITIGSYILTNEKGTIAISSDKELKTDVDTSKIQNEFNSAFGMLTEAHASVYRDKFGEDLKAETEKSADSIILLYEASGLGKIREVDKRALKKKLMESFNIDINWSLGYSVKFEPGLRFYKNDKGEEVADIEDGFSIYEKVITGSRFNRTERMELRVVDDLNSLPPSLRSLIAKEINQELRLAEDSGLAVTANISSDNKKFVLSYGKANGQENALVGEEAVYGNKDSAEYTAKIESLRRLYSQSEYINQLQQLSFTPEVRFGMGLEEDQEIGLNPAKYANACLLTSDVLKDLRKEKSIANEDKMAQPEVYYSLMLSVALSSHNISSESAIDLISRSINLPTQNDRNDAMRLLYLAAVESNMFDLSIIQSSASRPRISGKSKFDGIIHSLSANQNLSIEDLKSLIYLYERELSQNETSMVYQIPSANGGTDNLKLEEILKSGSPSRNLGIALKIAMENDGLEFESALKLDAIQAKVIYDYLKGKPEYREYVTGRHYPSEGIAQFPTSGAEFQRAYERFLEESKDFDKEQTDETTKDLDDARKIFAKAVSAYLPDRIACMFEAGKVQEIRKE